MIGLSEVASAEQKAKDQVSKTEEQFKVSPNLRDIKQAVFIP